MKLSERLRRLYSGFMRSEIEGEDENGNPTAVYRLSDWDELTDRLKSCEKAALKLEAKKK